jgi:hypothetical protein
MSKVEIGCCGAYCRTCITWQKEKYPNEHTCRGCKIGYEPGERDINKARCKMKICCFKDKKLETCADCPDYHSCKLIHDFYKKSGYKYKKYEQSIEFIRKNGYERFLEKADKWKGPYGKID